MTKGLTTEEINDIAVRNLSKEISLIDDCLVRIFVSKAVRAAPGRYWFRPAGNKPGHHPDDEHCDWGNLIHVKRVLVVAKLLADAERLDNICANILYAGLIIHDLGKYGIDGTSTSIDSKHPLLVKGIVDCLDPCFRLEAILRVAETHMGRWGIYKPATRYEKVGHYADFIASRHELHIPVELDV